MKYTLLSSNSILSTFLAFITQPALDPKMLPTSTFAYYPNLVSFGFEMVPTVVFCPKMC